ncbi:ABC transporter permease [Bacillus sp. ISL-51]|uniref:ABC transporter permease n=1 Tax=Bacteria TaxID=2 RepID=UPI001BE7B5EA|nr:MULTISPECIES: FtsX-like permease family protein [Bacteria]MBT2575799.1 ABC transporter permease [Bacillus sp. ISL-51]MBT2635851.1 ABC transporter permease [Bacillus sp. ISL-26]MBT2714019.1 ABC transporter permease [Pseudomonas sp. ISL-88]
MRFKDQVHFIRRNMKKNRLRVFMTVLATTMACAFLVVLSSVGFGIQKTITDITMSQQIVTEISVLGQENGKPIKKSDLEKYQHVKSVVERTQVNEPNKASLDSRTNEDSTIVLTNMKDEVKANMELDQGSVAKSENEIVVGYDFAKNLWTKKEADAYNKELQDHQDDASDVKKPKGYTKDLLNKTIQLSISKTNKDTGDAEETKTYDFKIVGITKKPSQDWMEDTNIFISDQFKKDFSKFLDFKGGNVQKSTKVYADKFDNVDQLTNDLSDDGYQVMSVTTELQGVNTFFLVFKIGLIFVGCIAVIISAIGIFNTMTMAVTERTQEIGIMKAIGASPTIIRRMFLMESAYIGILGSVIGIIISYGVSFAVNLAVPVILKAVGGKTGAEDLHYTFSYIPLSLVVIAVVICAGVAVLSGMNPARKATKTNVLTALRREL